MVDTGATHNFVTKERAKDLCLNYVASKTMLKTVNALPTTVHSFAPKVPIDLGRWKGLTDFTIVPMDVFNIILGVDFWYEVNAFISPRLDQLHINDAGGSCVVPLIRVPQNGMHLFAMQIVKGFKKGEPTFLATLVGGIGDSIEAVALPPCIEQGYYQVRIAEGDEPKTTCVTRYGAFDWLAMPFGLTNTPATFCTLMNKLFHPFLDQFVVIYLDDNVVYSHSIEEHVEHLCKVLKVLRENDLCVKREKGSFAQPSVQFLGHTISHGEIRMDSDKVEAIRDWEAPTKVPKLWSFLGLANYYRRFIFDYSAIAAPLTDLLKKGREWEWTDLCQNAFEKLKAAITDESVLALPDFTKAFEIHTDASDFAIGGVLMQEGHPIVFERRKLNDAERRYSAHEREMTAIVHCLRTWRIMYWVLTLLLRQTISRRLIFSPKRS
ncbi:hypothetical protein KY290_031126 [Solanum tuberosum]|uniref:Reverse transcriptase domain-containing protein n=1 Tax=Solanum tuberosum TaxID=4113 RepID=A0ABQ7UA35_SOLTU|nr:hypothetical protein KY290_031126 [Solanum tuberosum]